MNQNILVLCNTIEQSLYQLYSQSVSASIEEKEREKARVRVTETECWRESGEKEI
jgi:hypothetical protein